jgi:hypothetical protein
MGAVPTGELDFLVLPADFGLLAIERKGGVKRYDRTALSSLMGSG